MSETQRELSSFLRARRGALTPADVGLPPGRRRRTPGLRREEVAVLSGVSTEWYTWLEQARPIRASEATVRRIASALRLNRAEARHLLVLSGHGGAEEKPAERLAIAPRLQRLVDRLGDGPAYILGARWDFLAWNPQVVNFYGDLGALPEEERNCLHQTFLGQFRARMLDWERHAQAVVATFRSTYALHVGDLSFDALIHRLRQDSPEFRSWWNSQDVLGWSDGIKRFNIPGAGVRTFEHSAFDLADESVKGLRLVTYAELEAV